MLSKTEILIKFRELTKVFSLEKKILETGIQKF